MKRYACLFFAATLASSFVFAQSLRAKVTSVLAVSASQPEGVSALIKYNEAVAIQWPTDSAFIQGLELEIKVPKAFQGSDAQLAWAVYTKLTPEPSKSVLDYNGELIATQALPARVSLTLILPVIERHGIKSGAFASLIPYVAPQEKFPLLFKFSPIGKGMNPAMEKAEFKLTVRPVLRDEGALKLSLSYPDNAEKTPALVYIDDKKVDDPTAPLFIKKGAHVVRVSVEGYREEIITIAIEAGKTSSLSVSLVPNAPLFVFQAPAGTSVSLDGQAVSQSELSGISVETGEHIVVMKLGDYTMTRKIMAQRGKVYKIILSVELDVSTAP